MKYKFIDEDRILQLSPYMNFETMKAGYIYANEEKIKKEYENMIKEYKELVVEEKPTYNEETQELESWYEDGEVITQKFKVVDKVVNE